MNQIAGNISKTRRSTSQPRAIVLRSLSILLSDHVMWLRHQQALWALQIVLEEADHSRGFDIYGLVVVEFFPELFGPFRHGYWSGADLEKFGSILTLFSHVRSVSERLDLSF